MTITFRCSHCQKEVKAPDEAAGKRGKCPFCQTGNYIPAPVKEEDLLDLAPLDENEEQRAAREREEVRRKEKALLADMAGIEAPADADREPTSEDFHHHVVNYCLDLMNSNLDRLDQHVFQLKKNRPLGLQAVEEFLGDKVREPALKIIPPRVLKGFLAQLRDALR